MLGVHCVLTMDGLLVFLRSCSRCLSQMFGDSGYTICFGIVVLYLQFGEEKCLQSQSSEAFKI